MRFATTHLTFFRIHKQKINLKKMFFLEDWTTSKWVEEAMGKRATATILMPTFWTSIFYILKVFGPLVQVLRLVDGEKRPGMGYTFMRR